VVQKGSPVPDALFHGFRHVSFAPGHVGDTFLPLLETVRVIRSRTDPAVIAATEETRRARRRRASDTSHGSSDAT
jgi:hypothetical protein